MKVLMTDRSGLDVSGKEDWRVLDGSGRLRHCVGCFGCWVKTPATCVIRDDYQEIGKWLGASSDLVIVSECTYGSFSPVVKNLMDRAIPYISPHFKIINDETHHARRYENVLKFTVYFYGTATKGEMETAEAIVKGNVINFHGELVAVKFFPTFEAVKEELSCLR